MNKSFVEYMRYAERYCRMPGVVKHQRLGQAYFNALVEYDSEAADRLRSSLVDPFYLDNRLPEFFVEVADLLDKDNSGCP